MDEFSVVLRLRWRSAAAAREIKGLIGTSVDDIKAGTALIREAGGAMQNIVTANENVVGVIGKIAATTDDQAGGIEQIHNAIAHMESVTQQNAAMVEQASAAADAMRDHAHALQHLVERFKLSATVESRTTQTAVAARDIEPLPAPPARAALTRRP